MLILGLSDGLRPSAVLVEHGAVVAAASQPSSEGPAFPDEALDAALALAGRSLSEVGRVVFGTHIAPPARSARAGLLRQLVLKESGLWTIVATRRRDAGAARLGAHGFIGDVKTLDHFQALAEAAWRSQPREQALVLTASIGGDGTTLAVSAGGHDGLRLIYRQGGLSSLRDYRNSVADVVAVPDRPQDDLLPYLATGAEAPGSLVELFHHRLHFSRGGFGLSLRGGPSLVARETGEYTPAEIAAAWQANLERQFLRLLRHWSRETGLRHVVLGGEVFANAHLVHRLSRSEEVASLSVYPLGGDPALASGAALRYGDVGPRQFGHLFWGPDVDLTESRAALQAAGIEPVMSTDLPSRVARILAEGGGVLRVADREAWSHNSLGGRCLLCAPTDRGQVARLTSAVGLSPRLPGAAITLAHQAERCYEGDCGATGPGWVAATLAECTEWMATRCPAAVLPDGNARPLLVSAERHPALHSILEQYADLTGIPVLLALDLPAQPQPARRTPAGAIRILRETAVEALVLGPFWAQNQ